MSAVSLGESPKWLLQPPTDSREGTGSRVGVAVDVDTGPSVGFSERAVGAGKDVGVGVGVGVGGSVGVSVGVDTSGGGGVSIALDAGASGVGVGKDAIRSTDRVKLPGCQPPWVLASMV